MARPLPSSVAEAQALLQAGRYIADETLATALFMSLSLGRPLLIEGEAGCGKTELAHVLAETLGRGLVRLQCYEGLDASAAVYEWNYAGQMIAIRLAEHGGRGKPPCGPGDTEADAAGGMEAIAEDVFSDRFLIKRPLLRALEAGPGGAPVLLIDEIDRADPPFEAYLLEILSDFQVSVPELGTIRASERPIVVVTSNRTREVHDALKRRCVYHWIDYPDIAQEKAILEARLPGIADRLSAGIITFIERMRASDLAAVRDLREVIAWATAVIKLDKTELDPDTVRANLDRILAWKAQAAADEARAQARPDGAGA